MIIHDRTSHYLPGVAHVAAEYVGPKLGLIVAEYATSAVKVDTLLMTAFFKSYISNEWIEGARQSTEPDCGWCLGEVPKSVLPHAMTLQMTPERKLLAYAYIFFWYHTQDECAYMQFIHQIEGIMRISDMSLNQFCHGYVFGHHDWYRQTSDHRELVGAPEAALRFLNEKKYLVVDQVAVGCIVMYHSVSAALHYARVEGMDNTGRIIVSSKWGEGPTFMHFIDAIDCAYGYAVVFLRYSA